VEAIAGAPYYSACLIMRLPIAVFAGIKTTHAEINDVFFAKHAPASIIFIALGYGSAGQSRLPYYSPGH